MKRSSRIAGLTALGVASFAVTAGYPAYSDGKVSTDDIHKQFAAKDAIIADLRRQVADLQAQLDALKAKGPAATAAPAAPIASAGRTVPAVAMDSLPQYHAVALSGLPTDVSGVATGSNAYGYIAGYSLNKDKQKTPITWNLSSIPVTTTRPGLYPGRPGMYPGGPGTYPGGAGMYPGGPGANMAPGMAPVPGDPGGNAADAGGGPGTYPGGPGMYPGGPGAYQGGPGMTPNGMPGAPGAVPAPVKTPKFDYRVPKAVGTGNGVATAINVEGIVIGTQNDHATLWRKAEAEDLGVLEGTKTSEALSINSRGDVVGDAVNDAGVKLPFQKLNGAAMEPLGLLTGWTGGVAKHISDLGMIVGRQEKAGGISHACFWINGAPTDLGTLGGDNSEAQDVNNTGIIIGYSENADKKKQACYWRSGKVHELPMLGDGKESKAHGINDAGVIVGEANGGKAVAWIHEKVYDLNTAVKDKGFTIKKAIAIDPNGGILAWGSIPDVEGDYPIFLMPIKPATKPR